MTQRTYIMLALAAMLAAIVLLRQFVWTESDVLQPVAPDSVQIHDVEYSEETGNFLPDFAAFDAVLDRPLFRSDRRPALVQQVDLPIQTSTASTTDDGPPDFIVVGTVTGPDGGVATIRDQNETSRIHVGDTVAGWRIDAITGSDIEVSRNGNRYRLGLGERE
ncbi:MAG: hypothetical protein DHS20C06_13860 [Hyphobacterium sp.]|nr:MAG: hypothetical protein DHS20C06_13860 [Hyphobacterium sp.]